jgi:hypothetical protein
VIVKVLDWLLTIGATVVVATTQRGVGTVPEVTVVETVPSLPEFAEEGENVTPVPETLVGSRLKATLTPCLPVFVLSTTLNLTRELCGNSGEPVPLTPIIFGLADTNCILLNRVGWTVIFAADVAPLVTDAVIVSITADDPEAHPLSLYVEIAVPAELFTGEDRVAPHAEINVTEIGIVAGEPFINTGTLRLLVP